MPSPRSSRVTSRATVETSTLAALAFGLSFAAGIAFFGPQALDTVRISPTKPVTNMMVQPNAGTTKNQGFLQPDTGTQLLPEQRTGLTIRVNAETRTVSPRSGQEIELFSFVASPAIAFASTTPATLKYFSIDTTPANNASGTPLAIQLNNLQLYANDVRVPTASYNIYQATSGKMKAGEVRTAGLERAFVFNSEYTIASTTRFSIRSSWTGSPRVGEEIVTRFSRFATGRGAIRGTLNDYATIFYPCSESDICGNRGILSWSDLAAGAEHSATVGKSSNDWLNQDALSGFNGNDQITVRVGEATSKR